MIIRSIVRRHGARTLASPIPRSCTRFISQDTSSTGLTPEALEALTNAAALDQVPQFGSQTAANAKPRRDNKAETFKELRRLEKATASIGSRVSRPYNPEALITTPPEPQDVTLELLMASQTHMGHHKSRWNPANARYIYGVRQEIHIISLEATAAHLRRASRVVEEVAYYGGLILFVGTRKGQMDIVTRAAAAAKGCHLFTKWTPGSITNRDVLLRDRQLRIVDEKDEDVEGFATHIRDRRPIAPDLVVCLNPKENKTMLHECGFGSIPTIGVVDTDTDPTWVTYPIPANDDSLRSTAVIGGVLGRAGQIGQKRRLADAEAGVVAWETPLETKKYMDSKLREYREEQEKWSQEAADEINEKRTSSALEKKLLDMGEAERKSLFQD